VHILIVSAEDDGRRRLHLALDRRGHAVAAVADVAAALRHAAHAPVDVAIAMPPLARELLVQADRPPVIALLADRDAAAAIALLAAGAIDVLGDPVDELALDLALARVPARSARGRVPAHAVAAPVLLGESSAMVALRKTIAQVGASRATVLISGESGTGKELVAHGGTLFLDEIAELPLALQAKLLRALQDDELRRVGDTASVRIDVRVIAATLRDLPREIEAGRFREDLYFRLAVVPIAVPPLRERADDIPALARHVVDAARARGGRDLELTADALAALAAYAWPGNVRELENAIARAIVLAEAERIDAAFLATILPGIAAPRESAAAPVLDDRDPAADLDPEADASPLSLRRATRALERELIVKALAATGGNRTQAARQLGISQRALQYKMKELGVTS